MNEEKLRTLDAIIAVTQHYLDGDISHQECNDEVIRILSNAGLYEENTGDLGGGD